MAQATTWDFAAESERSSAFNWKVLVALFGLACLPLGSIWDISHHVTIGRDTFWTPAHIVIQLGGIVPALLFTWLAIRTTFSKNPLARQNSVRFFGARAPLGVWVSVWGAVAMVSSAPFDNWWHDTYGLDVKIISPPHTVLGVGMLMVGFGILLFVFSTQNQSPVAGQRHLGLFCALAVGIMMALEVDFATEFCWPNLQHGATFYRVICAPFPFLLVLAARAARIRGAATIAAATCMAMYIFLILVLPLFPAHPKLAPIYHPVDHMVPPAFPPLLIVPALAIDLIEWLFGRRAGGRGWNDWLLALVLGTVFFLIIWPIQWNFSTFLLSDAADNRFFARSGHWPYFVEPGAWMNSFWERRDVAFGFMSAIKAVVVAFIASRLGLWLGNFLLRLQR